MKNTNLRKKALLSSVAMLLVALVALGSATFAWFSAKTEATASALSANTTQGTNLMISESKTTGWTQELTFANADTTKLDPVTTDDLTTWYKSTADGWDTQAATGYTSTSKTGYVLEQDIYVKYQTDSGDFSLGADLDITVNEGTDDYYRVAITPLTGDGLAAPDGFTQYIYADSATVKATGATHAGYTVGTDTLIELGTISAGSIYGYHVAIWFEGEDPECIDSNSTNDISLGFTFTEI